MLFKMFKNNKEFDAERKVLLMNKKKMKKNNDFKENTFIILNYIL